MNKCGNAGMLKCDKATMVAVGMWVCAIVCGLLLALLVSGCASKEAYRAYTEAIVQANAYRKAPGIRQEFGPDGRLTAQEIIMPDQGVPVEQIKDSEWARPLTNVFMTAVGFAGVWANSHEWQKAISNVQPNISTSVGGHQAGGDVQIPTTTTTTTETTTTTTDESTHFTEQ